MKNVKPKKFGLEMPQEKYYPTFTMKVEDIPEAKHWEVGKDYNVKMRVTQSGMHKSKHHHDVTFEIKKIAPVGNRNASKTDVKKSVRKAMGY